MSAGITFQHIDECVGAIDEVIEAYAPHNDLITSRHAEDREDGLVDLLTDLQHYADRHGIDFASAVERAQYHHDEDRIDAQAEWDYELAEAAV